MHLRTVSLLVALVLSVAFEGGAQQGPTVVNVSPVPESTVRELTFINVIFNDSVFGIDRADLLINGAASATSITTNNPNDYTFYFSPPANGTVQVAWAPNHGITGYQQPPDPFAGGSWTYTLDPNATPPPDVIISEFMADNGNGIQDEDGLRGDWLELQNRGTLEVNLSGWYLTDDRLNLTKWQFPAGMSPLATGNSGYLRVWASEKDRRAPLSPLHTNFKLSKNPGSFLALVDPRTNIVSAFDPYPEQFENVSYGRDRVDPSIMGYFSTATPGAANSTTGSGIAAEPTFSLETGIYTNSSLTLTITGPPGATIRYTRDGTIPTATSLLYSSPITFNNNSTFKVRVFQNGLLPSRVVARNFIFLDGTTANFDSNLPLLIISTEGRAVAENVAPGAARTRAAMALIDTSRGRASLRDKPEFQGFMDIEVAGQTSAGFGKRPYRFEIQDEMLTDRSVSLLGMPADADWRLRNPYNDKTLMNDFLAFELFEKMGHYSVRRKFVEVFVDSGGGRLSYPGDYIGVEVLCEHIKQDNDRVDVEEMTPQATNEPAITGGYIFKKDKDSNGDLNFSTAGGGGFPPEALKMHEPRPNALRNAAGVTTSWPGPGYTPSGSNQMNYLVRYLNRMELAMYTNTWLSQTGTNHYSHYMDVDSFVDLHWIVEFTKQIDGYRLSSFFHKPRNGKVTAGPIWDWNLAYGNANYLRGGQTNGWYFAEQDQGMTANEHIWLRRLINGNAAMGAGNALGPGGDPDFNQKIADRWSVLRTNQMSLSNTLDRIDELSTTLSEAAARDLWGKWRSGLIGVYTWPNPDGSGDGRDVDFVRPTNYLGNDATSIIWQMKKWMTGRYNWIDAQFTPLPTLSASEGSFSNSLTLTIVGPPNTVVYYTLDGTDPRGRLGVTNGIRYTGPITVNGNVRVVARAKGTNQFYNTWSGPAAATLYNSTPALRITEIMYHPLPPAVGSTNTDEDFEFIEVKNIGTTPLNVNRFVLSGGVDFEFPSLVLQPGQLGVVVKNIDAFRSRYGSGPSILGTYTGSLDNAGDHIVLRGPVLEPILDFSYSDEWYPITDGSGFSLVINNESAPRDTWGLASSWRVSSALNGSPGQNDPAPPNRPGIVITEALTHTDPPAIDTIELHNPTAAAVNIGGWFLSDSFDNAKKFIIPSTNIPAGGYVIFTEAQFGAGTTGFALGSQGDDVWLFSGDGVNLTGYSHGYSFGASANGVSFGRHVTSVGDDHFVAQRGQTLGAANAGPLVGPIVISEIHYRPPDVTIGTNAYNNGEDEFIELRNTSNSVVPLFDPAYPTNTWRLRDAVDFDFPQGVTLPALSGLLVVSFDPSDTAALAAFRARNGVPGTVPVFGPFEGQLDNSGESLELERPDVPQPPISSNPGFVPYILVERVRYSNATPWPAGADGIGLSLQRSNESAYGNDPAHWAAGGPTPGSAHVGGTLPVITGQPTNTSVIAYYGQTTFSVQVANTAGTRYQWRFGDFIITGATNSTLVLTNVQPSQAGNYNVVVYNGGGAVISTNATLTVLIPVAITTHPGNLFMRGSNDMANYGRTFADAVFNVQASSGNPPVTYRWFRNGVAIPGETSPVLTVRDVTLDDEGVYHAEVSDAISTAPSREARLTVGVAPFVTEQMQGQTVVVGSTVNLQIAARGNPAPMGFRFRRSGLNLTNMVGTPTSRALTIPNIRTNDAGNYTAIVTNSASYTPGVLSSNTYVTVVVPPTNQVVDAGSDVTFRVAAYGPSSTGPPTRYQWKFNGGDLLNATNSTLTVTNAQTSGTYSVVVSVTANPLTPPIAPATFSADLTINGQMMLSSPQRLPDGTFQGALAGGVDNQSYLIEVSTNLIHWAASSTIRYTNNPTRFTDPGATNSPRRFYRVREPQ
jgi:hypothetical protein